MTIKKMYLRENPYYKKGVKLVPKGLMLHSVGCAQPSAPSFVKSWNSPTYTRACVHAFIDANDGTVYQTLPWDMRGPHCGGKANNTHIGVEMCEPGCIKYVGGSTFICSDLKKAQEAAKRTYASAVELFAQLCKTYSLDPMGKDVILGHAEGHRRGLASGHADPEHLWQQLYLPYTMDGFRKDVQTAMGGVPVKADVVQGCPFQVRVDITDLNIRTGPGTNYAKTGPVTGIGIFSIVEVREGKGSNAGWGRLKSGAGWIALAYAKRI